MKALCTSRPSRAFLAGLILLASFLLHVPPAAAQQGPYVPWVGKRGVTETVDQIMARERGLPHEAIATPRVIPRPVQPDRTHLPQNPLSPFTSQWPVPAAIQGDAHDATPSATPDGPGGIGSPQTAGVGFDAITIGSTIGYIPPDSCGAAGPTQILACANGRIRVFSKTGTLGGLNATTDSFFSSVVTTGQSTSDPQVKYDPTSGRFIVTIIDVTPTSNSVLIAVSSGSVITGTSSFTFYGFQHDLVSPPGDAGQFADYPKTGVDANAIYIGINVFGPGGVLFIGSTGFVIKKSSVLSGGPIQVTAFRGLGMNGGSDGPFAPTGVDNSDPAATEGYFIGSSIFNLGTLVMRRVSDPGGTPSISANLILTVPATSTPLAQPAMGSTNTLDSLDDRLFAAMVHKDRLTGVTSLWTAHNIAVNASGVASGGNRNGSRWYQLGSLAGTPSVIQSGTLFDSAGSNPRGFWIPSCAMSGQGHMAIGSSYAGNADRAGVAAAGRLSGDALGTTQAPTLVAVSTHNYNIESTSPQRWGDFSSTWVDPMDDQTIWTFQEWCDANNSWAVRVVQLLAPPPVTPTSASPSTVAQGSSFVDVVVSGVSSAGSGNYDTEPGLNRIQASISNPDVTVNSVTWNSPTQVTVNLSVGPSAAVGPTDVSITNPDGQTATSALGVLNIGDAGPGTAYCFGDGTLATACPCGNEGSPGRGCDNSIATGGARLSATGNTNPDSVVLSSSGERPTSLSIFLQGSSNVPAGAVFGDGVRCAGGTLKRLFAKNASGGTATAPQGGDPSITARSAQLGDVIPNGGTRFYGVYYRDPAANFCPSPTGGTFNISNSMRIVWQ